MLPVVGVTPLWDKEKQSLWMLPGYLEGLRQAGCLPVILPLTKEPKEIDQILSLVDGILLTGGQDVSPALYGEAPTFAGEICEMRDAMEAQLLKKAMVLDKPMLGICRGIQFLNVALGGSLYQDIPRQHPSSVEHHQSPPYDQPSHEVALVQGSPLQSLLGQEKLLVNSYHHQAIKGACRWSGSDGAVRGRSGGSGPETGSEISVGGAVAPGVFLPDGESKPPDFHRLRRGDDARLM